MPGNMKPLPRAIHDSAYRIPYSEVIRRCERFTDDNFLAAAGFDISVLPQVQVVQDRIPASRYGNESAGCRFIQTRNVQETSMTIRVWTESTPGMAAIEETSDSGARSAWANTSASRKAE